MSDKMDMGHLARMLGGRVVKLTMPITVHNMNGVPIGRVVSYTIYSSPDDATLSSQENVDPQEGPSMHFAVRCSLHRETLKTKPWVGCNAVHEDVVSFDVDTCPKCEAMFRESAIQSVYGPAGEGVFRIASERTEQMDKWSDRHDDEHGDYSLAVAAARLALSETCLKDLSGDTRGDWGLVEKHLDYVDRLTIAGALIAAEIDRVLRVRRMTQVSTSKEGA